MNENLATVLGFAIFFSFLTAYSWLQARRREREAYYRMEAIKKIAELQGNVPEPVLQLLRDALPPAVQPTQWNLPTQAHYRSEALKRIVDRYGEAEPVLQYLREEQRATERQLRGGLRLGGLITLAAGAGITVFLRLIVPGRPIYAVGLIPILVGAALLAFTYWLGPKDPGEGATP